MTTDELPPQSEEPEYGPRSTYRVKNLRRKIVGGILIGGIATATALGVPQQYVGYYKAKHDRVKKLEKYAANEQTEVKNNLGRKIICLNFVYSLHSGVHVRYTSDSINKTKFHTLFGHTATPDNIAFTVPKGKELDVYTPIEHHDQGSLWPQFRMRENTTVLDGDKDQVAKALAGTLLTVSLSNLSMGKKSDNYEKILFPNLPEPYAPTVACSIDLSGQIESGKRAVAIAEYHDAGEATSWQHLFTGPTSPQQ